MPRGSPGEPGRFSQAHEGVAYGCCVPALTRFTNPHCPGPPRLTLTPASLLRTIDRPLSSIGPPASRARSRNHACTHHGIDRRRRLVLTSPIPTLGGRFGNP